MGDVLDYERGKLCIGRKVRLFGHESRQHGMGAMLKGVERNYAIVRPFGHAIDERVEWKHVQDWPSMNGGPAPKPEPPPKPMPVIRRMPELTALEHKELKAMNPTTVPAPKPTPAAVASLRDAVQAADLSDMGSLGERLQAAQRNLQAARKMVEEAKAEEAAAIKVFADLRAQAKKALEMIEAAAGGTA